MMNSISEIEVSDLIKVHNRPIDYWIFIHVQLQTRFRELTGDSSSIGAFRTTVDVPLLLKYLSARLIGKWLIWAERLKKTKKKEKEGKEKNVWILVEDSAYLALKSDMHQIQIFHLKPRKFEIR